MTLAHCLALGALLDPAAIPQAARDEGYLVLAGSDEPGFVQAAERLAKAHHAPVERWDGDWQALAALLHARKPRQLALVLRPEAIDANLPRRLAPLLAELDADPFLDCTFGLITGASGAEALRFVDNILKASKKDLPARQFSATAVQLERCMRVGPGSVSDGVVRALESNELWLTGQDPEWREFLARERDLAEGCGLIEWGHCGDSQGIWLFSMYRNLEREKHWPFDPARVGEDPRHEMPRLGVRDLLEGVELYPAVVVNGACHSAVTRRTMAGSDIVSTFGDTGGVIRFVDIAPEQSFPLMAIRAGATAYIGALAANNANRAAMEEWWIRRGGIPLGEVVKRTFDELVLGDVQRRLEFELFREGEPEPGGTPMFEDCAHRVLFGDPAFVPWRTVVPTRHDVVVEPIEGGLRVALRWKELAFDPWVWDPWCERTGGEGDRGRLYERIPLGEGPTGVPEVVVKEAFAVRGGAKKPIALEAFALLERDPDGAPVLHLKARGSRREMDARGLEGGPQELEASFVVRFRGPETGR